MDIEFLKFYVCFSIGLDKIKRLVFKTSQATYE